MPSRYNHKHPLPPTNDSTKRWFCEPSTQRSLPHVPRDRRTNHHRGAHQHDLGIRVTRHTDTTSATSSKTRRPRVDLSVGDTTRPATPRSALCGLGSESLVYSGLLVDGLRALAGTRSPRQSRGGRGSKAKRGPREGESPGCSSAAIFTRGYTFSARLCLVLQKEHGGLPLNVAKKNSTRAPRPEELGQRGPGQLLPSRGWGPAAIAPSSVRCPSPRGKRKRLTALSQKRVCDFLEKVS